MGKISSEMNSTYRLRFEATEDIEKAISKLSKNELVAEISMNYYRLAHRESHFSIIMFGSTILRCLSARTICTCIVPPGQYVLACPPAPARAQIVPKSSEIFRNKWGLKKINCPTAWTRTKGSSSVTVAVVDTGVDLNHPDLAANLVTGYDCVDLVGVEPQNRLSMGRLITVSRDSIPQDEVGHMAPMLQEQSPQLPTME